VTPDLREQLQQTLGSSYTLEQELGGGGMSRVFVATEAALGRKVVVKVLPPEMAAAVNIDRFRREIQLAAQLQHPHIVPLLSAGDTNGLPYFTMPYVRGESLRARLSRSGELPVSEAMRILREVSSALAYAHENGVVHRDIKPDADVMHELDAMTTPSGGLEPTRAVKSVSPGVARSRSILRPILAVAGGLVLLIAVGFGATVLKNRDRPAATDATPKLAVLPFQNLGRPEDAYFADGMTEELTEKLASLKGLRVIGRQSAIKYANTDKSVQQI